MRSSAVRTVGLLGASAATPSILAAIERLLTDPEPVVRSSAVGTVGSLGASAATPSILAVIERLLADSGLELQAGAADALCALGKRAATEGVCRALAAAVDSCAHASTRTEDSAYRALLTLAEYCKA